MCFFYLFLFKICRYHKMCNTNNIIHEFDVVATIPIHCRNDTSGDFPHFISIVCIQLCDGYDNWTRISAFKMGTEGNCDYHSFFHSLKQFSIRFKRINGPKKCYNFATYVRDIKHRDLIIVENVNDAL